MKDEYDFSKGRRGAFCKAPGKTFLTLCLDDDVVSWFRNNVKEKGGGSSVADMNDVLKKYVKEQQLSSD
ncbi:BrnA antitoxin family protein [Magnetococcales bacterium HHB-1]